MTDLFSSESDGRKVDAMSPLSATELDGGIVQQNVNKVTRPQTSCSCQPQGNEEAGHGRKSDERRRRWATMNQFSPIVDKIQTNISERSWKLAGTTIRRGRLVKFVGSMDRR
jgi:hypothetical protein